MSIRKMVITSLLISGMGVSTLAYAAKLTIFNDTDNISTAKINGKCSTDSLGSVAGKTMPHQQKDITDLQIRIACQHNPKACEAKVYMKDKCDGDVVTTVIFNREEGIKSVTPPIAGYTIKYEPFYIAISSIK